MDNAIYFTAANNFRAVIVLGRFSDLPINNIRKIFQLILSEPTKNREAVYKIDPYLVTAVEDSKKEWQKASEEYIRGWRDINGIARPAYLPAQEKRKIIRENNRLTRAVKQSRNRYERWTKIQTMWNDTKVKMKFDEKEIKDYVSE